jgi:glutathione S-transferase
MVEETYLANGGGKFLVGDKLTIADLFVCHYRFVLGQPEFSALCQTFFEGPNAPRFRAYYLAHLAGPIGEYFKSRLGAAASPDAERIKAIVEKEVRLEHSSGIEFPFVW